MLLRDAGPPVSRGKPGQDQTIPVIVAGRFAILASLPGWWTPAEVGSPRQAE